MSIFSLLRGRDPAGSPLPFGRLGALESARLATSTCGDVHDGGGGRPRRRCRPHIRRRRRPAPPSAGSVAAFFYPWYGTPSRDGAWQHWGQGGRQPPHAIASGWYPVRGAYSSSDRGVLRAQMSEIAAAGIDTVIVSWWGPGSVGGRAPAGRRLVRARRRASRRRARGAVRGARSGDPRAGPPAPRRRRRERLLRLRLRAIPRRELAGPERPARRTARLRQHRAAGQGPGRRVRRPLHLRRAALRRLLLPARVRVGTRAWPRVRTLCRAGIRRTARDGRPARAATRERRPLRPHVAGGSARPGRHRHDHELQRVARGHADRARSRGDPGLRVVRRRLGHRRAGGRARLPRQHGPLGRPVPRSSSPAGSAV